MDGSDEESYIPISDELLTDEVASMDIYGNLTCTYEDNYLTTTKFNQDKYASSNATCSGGKVRITTGGYLTYKFYGPHPTLHNSMLTANMNKVAGSPIIQVSSDGVVWKTAVTSAQILNNIATDYYIDGSEKLGDFYVRFYCPSGATLDIFDVEFTTIRDTSYYDVPYIPPWEARTIKVTGTGSAVAGIDFVFRSRKWP